MTNPITHLSPIKCHRNTKITLSESELPGAWLRMSADMTQMGHLKRGESSAHLTIEQVGDLKAQLDWILEKHFKVNQ